MRIICIKPPLVIRKVLRVFVRKLNKGAPEREPPCFCEYGKKPALGKPKAGEKFKIKNGYALSTLSLFKQRAQT